MKKQIKELRVKIDGFSGYNIDEIGNVYSLERKIYTTGNNNKKGYKINKERKLKPNKDKDGYLYVVLQENKRKKTIKIHRLVANGFIPNPKNLPQVNHIDGNKENNCINNLEWCTSSHNVKHSYTSGLKYITQKQKDLNSLQKRGENNNTSKLKENQVIEIKNRVKNGESQYSLAKEYNVSSANINNIIKGKIWKHLI